jgi:triacylglycerol esterase/lipase EstA (alpha/beta hydrolase family)
MCSGTIILSPTKDTNRTDVVEAGVIFIQGAEIEAKYYTQFSLQLQAKFNGKLWVALTEFPLNTPEPLLIGKIIGDSFADFSKAGLNLRKDTPIFYIGHSLGGIMLQDYLFKNQEKLEGKISGLILEGSYIERKHYAHVTESLILPPILGRINIFFMKF